MMNYEKKCADLHTTIWATRGMLFNLLATTNGEAHDEAKIIYDYLELKGGSPWIAFDGDREETWPFNMEDVLCSDGDSMWESFFNRDTRTWAGKAPIAWMPAPELPKK